MNSVSPHPVSTHPVDPQPHSYIDEFRDDYPELDYIPRTRELTIEGMAEAA
jgi:hypothetical protein